MPRSLMREEILTLLACLVTFLPGYWLALWWGTPNGSIFMFWAGMVYSGMQPAINRVRQ